MPDLLEHWVNAMAAPGAGRRGATSCAADLFRCLAEALTELGFCLRLAGAITALLVRSEHAAHLLLAVAERSGPPWSRVRVYAFAALAALTSNGFKEELQRCLWASPALPAVFEQLLKAEVAAYRGGASGPGSAAGASGTEGAAAYLFEFLLGGHDIGHDMTYGRSGEMLLSWLDGNRLEREPALDLLLARMLDDRSPSKHGCSRRWVGVFGVGWRGSSAGASLQTTLRVARSKPAIQYHCEL